MRVCVIMRIGSGGLGLGALPRLTSLLPFPFFSTCLSFFLFLFLSSPTYASQVSPLPYSTAAAIRPSLRETHDVHLSYSQLHFPRH